MISITGQLAIRTISGRLGLFNVGRRWCGWPTGR